MEYKDYYKILGVAKGADEKEIKRAYRKLARQYHPDKNPGDKAAEDKFKEINEAYEVLGDSDNRQKYDQLGANWFRYQQAGGRPGAGPDFSDFFRNQSGGAYQVNIEDLFGGAGGSGGFSDFFNAIFGSRGARSQAQPVVGRNIDHDIDIMLEEAYHGTTRTLVREDGERITAKIPRGARTGTRIRLRGKGSPGPAGPGDLMINVRVRPHHRFKRDGDNLRLDLDVDLYTAVLGGKASVDTLDGPVTLTIPAGTQGGQSIRLTGKGMPNLRDRERVGDLLVRVRIRIPKQLGDDERALFQQLQALRQGRGEAATA